MATTDVRVPAAGEDRFPGFDAPLDIPDLNHPENAKLIAQRMRDGSMDDFSQALGTTHNCAHPVRLSGSSVTVDTATGEVLSSFDASDLPFGVLHRACGNRRASVCPSCSRTYARDTYALIHAGVAGGKSVPDQVRDNPLLFVTLTAPSFGPVHGHRSGRACRPRRRDGRSRCPHGRPLWCTRVHDRDDDINGAPLCFQCHDTASAVMWQWHAPELWRRFTIALHRAVARHLAVPDSRLGEHASIQYAKVAEHQARGLIHFHALIRLDGPAAGGTGSPAPPSIDGAVLAALVHQVVPTVTTLSEPVDVEDTPRVLAFGTQVDVRTVRAGSRTDDPAGPLTPDQVAGYLAKYSTKDSSGLHGRGQGRPHILALRRQCREMAARAAAFHDRDHDYQRMGKWVHCLGFRGHFGTKSRRYSLTLGALRRARSRWQALAAESRRTGQPLDTRDLEARLLADDAEETTQVIGTLDLRRHRLARPPRASPGPGGRRPQPRVRPVESRTPQGPRCARQERTMMEPQMQDQPTPVLERLLTTAEVAEALQISPSTLCRWRQVGHGPRVTWLTPFSPRYQREDVAAWVKRSAA